MNVLKSVMLAMAMLLLSANFLFGQNTKPFTEQLAFPKFEINIVDMSQREISKVATPRPPANVPVRVEISNNKGDVIFQRRTNGDVVYVSRKIDSSKDFYTINIWQGKALILSVPYSEL